MPSSGAIGLWQVPVRLHDAYVAWAMPARGEDPRPRQFPEGGYPPTRVVQGKVPAIVRRERSIEIRPYSGWWFRWEGRVTERILWELPSGEHQHGNVTQVYPKGDHLPAHRSWMKRRDWHRLKRKLEGWVAEQEAEANRRAAVATFPT